MEAAQWTPGHWSSSESLQGEKQIKRRSRIIQPIITETAEAELSSVVQNYGLITGVKPH